MSISPAPLIGVHLDLKYLMPRKEYLHRWLREIAARGINALLLEYEDKFPYHQYSFLQDEDAFTPDELRRFLDVAHECELEVIPLVQTLSHLEFALSHEHLAHLREAPDILTQINPSNPEALAFVHEMIEEVLAYHQEDRYFHLGADETWFVGTHPDYAAEVKALGLPRYWVQHLRPYIEQVVQAGKRPLAWDDVFWKEPEIVAALDLPRELILVSWDYTIRPVDADENPKGDPLSRVDTYQKAGFEVLGAPCLNWGVLTPMHDHVLENTTAWAAKVKQSHLAGLLNTSWSVFHTPLPTQMPYIAATPALLDSDTPHLDDAWAINFAREFFGVRDERFPGALRDLSLLWEQNIEGLGRPITPIVYGYMDLVLHFGSQENRMKAGVYPLNWNDVDFRGIYEQKMELLRRLDDRESMAIKLAELQTDYSRAGTVFRDLAERAQRHQAEARLLHCCATLKCLHTQAVEYFLFGRGDAGLLQQAFQKQKVLLRECLLPFYETRAVERFLVLWWEPAAAALAAETPE
jgi:hypothetical protein